MDYLSARMAVLNRKHKWSTKHANRKSVNIFVFRHGHTVFNEEHRFCGWKNSTLSVHGINDAKKLAKRLSKEDIDIAFHSSLSRSKNTLKIAIGGHGECQVSFCDDRIIERSYGDLEGKTHKWFVSQAGKHDLIEYLHWHKAHFLDYNHSKDLIKKFGEKDLEHVRRGYSVVPPNGESVQMVEKRVMAFIDDLLVLCREYKVNVALSVHGNSMRPIRKYFEDLSTKEMMHLENPWDQVFVYSVKV